MFIAAVLHAPGGANAVRIRNMSRGGALLDGPVLPPAGTAVTLMRGGLRATGEIVWSAGGRCGVRLDASLAIPEWMANPAHHHQGLVDKMVADIKSELAAPAPPALPAADLRGDIARLRALLDVMSDDLTGEPDTLARHATSLQHLDIAGQMLDALLAAVDPDFERRRLGFHRLDSLRRSGDAALKRAA